MQWQTKAAGQAKERVEWKSAEQMGSDRYANAHFPASAIKSSREVEPDLHRPCGITNRS